MTHEGLQNTHEVEVQFASHLEALLSARRKEYEENSDIKQRHLAGRLVETYKKHAQKARESFWSLPGNEESVPVLINKHFTALFMDFCAEKDVDLVATNKIISLQMTNPQMPREGSPFMDEWGTAISLMKKELHEVYNDLREGNFVDYLAWELEKVKSSGKKFPYLTTLMHVSGPDVYTRISKTLDLEIYEAVARRVVKSMTVKHDTDT